MEQGKNLPPIKHPPITIGPAIHLAWGLSMAFSHEEGQRSMGQIFTDRFKELWEEAKYNLTARRYLDNLSGLLSACVRNIGWQRDVYVRYLDARDKEREERIKSANDLGDITSLNTESILSRLMAILFGGSAMAMFLPGATTAEFEAEVALAGIEPGLLWFLLGGAAGFILITVALKVWKTWRVSKIIKRTFNLKQKYWRKTAREGFKEALTAFAMELNGLEGKYYPEFYNKEEPLKEYFEKSKIHEFIDQKVLPSTDSYITEWM